MDKQLDFGRWCNCRLVLWGFSLMIAMASTPLFTASDESKEKMRPSGEGSNEVIEPISEPISSTIVSEDGFGNNLGVDGFAGGTYGEPRLLVRPHATDRFQHLSWPKVVRTSGGNLVVAYSAGVGHLYQSSGLAVSVSSDEGLSFSRPKLLRTFPDDDPRYRHCGNLALGLAHDGSVVLLAMAYQGNERHTIFGYRSTDEGVTWEEADTSELGKSRTGSVYGHIIALPDGRLGVAGHYRPGGIIYEQGIWLAYSEDDGRSWGRPKRITERRFQEPAMIYTRLGFLGILRDWGDGNVDYSMITNSDGADWEIQSNVLGIDVPPDVQVFPSPFIVADPARPERLWLFKSTRGARKEAGRKGGISLWTTDISEIDDLQTISWSRVGPLVEWSGDNAHHVDFTYPWMTHLEENRWFVVFYSGRVRGRNDLYGMTIQLDPKSGTAMSDGQLPGEPLGETGLLPVDLPGAILTEEDASFCGSWRISMADWPYVAGGYRTDGNLGKGDKRATFHMELAEPGNYLLRISYQASDENASNVPVTVFTEVGPKRLTLNQQKEPCGEHNWETLGTYRFGPEAKVEIRNEGTDGYVIIDAIQFLRQ